MRRIMTWPEHLPKLCPGCGSPYSEDWVGGFFGFHGWLCGSYDAGTGLRQSKACAVMHWKTRALKAEEALLSHTMHHKELATGAPDDSGL